MFIRIRCSKIFDSCRSNNSHSAHFEKENKLFFNFFSKMYIFFLISTKNSIKSMIYAINYFSIMYYYVKNVMKTITWDILLQKVYNNIKIYDIFITVGHVPPHAAWILCMYSAREGNFRLLSTYTPVYILGSSCNSA